MTDKVSLVRECFARHQEEIVELFRRLDSSASSKTKQHFLSHNGESNPIVFSNGDHIEKAAVLRTLASGRSLPQAATQRHPHLAERPFQAVSISVIVHPRNPHVPTAHMNLRFFSVDGGASLKTWYFGGGLDLTPFLPYEEDAIDWHKRAAAACPDEATYGQLKENCDNYFYLPHRNEHRGIGGLFFDDWNKDSFAECLQFVDRIGKSFAEAYQRIFQRRREIPYSSAEEQWMLIRRGRYAEFNLIHDRGTRYGLQSARNIESVLASLPPRARWEYEYEIPSELRSSPAARLESFLQPRDWLQHVDKGVEK